ncbi:MAG: aldose 1-epimerase [Eubacteriales bacterium]|nr:aldose 1-epimerase [Eubacteriales bacterium]
MIKVSPELGNNLFCFRIGEHDIVWHDDQFGLTSYYTGNPILYPFPNRVENCRYTINGERQWQMKNGIPIFMHSLVYDENWGYREPVIEDDGVTLETYLDIDETHPVYEGFPICHTISIFYKVTANGLQISHKVTNRDQKELPFGISYHTFFTKLSGDEATLLKVPAKHMMELTDALLPTGVLLDTAQKEYDLQTPVSICKLDLDNCFTTMDPSDPVVVDYTTLGLRVFMTSTNDYTHVQVFTPKGRPFFCAEKQTSSSDAPNLDAKGFVKEAHLLRVSPGESHQGTVSFSYEFYKTDKEGI